MKRVPRLASVMTPFPHSVELGVSAQVGLDLMREHDIHHLPVTDQHRVFSLVSADVIAQETQRSGRAPKDFSIGDVCQREAYLVDLSTPLDVVLDNMAERNIECAVATRGERAAGVFTSADVCRLLAKLVRGESAVPDDVA